MENSNTPKEDRCPVGMECPNCGEDDTDVLLIHDETEVPCPICKDKPCPPNITCGRCKTVYST